MKSVFFGESNETADGTCWETRRQPGVSQADWVRTGPDSAGPYSTGSCSAVPGSAVPDSAVPDWQAGRACRAVGSGQRLMLIGQGLRVGLRAGLAAGLAAHLTAVQVMAAPEEMMPRTALIATNSPGGTAGVSGGSGVTAAINGRSYASNSPLQPGTVVKEAATAGISSGGSLSGNGIGAAQLAQAAGNTAAGRGSNAGSSSGAAQTGTTPAMQVQPNGGSANSTQAGPANVVMVPAGEAMTLERALALADEGHPRLRAGVARIDEAAAGMLTAKAYPNPEVGAQAGRQTFRVPGNVSGLVQSFSLAQPLELGPLRSTRMQYAERGKQVQTEALSAIRLEVLSSVRRAFYQALRYQGEIAILTENQRIVEQFRDRTKVRVDVGEAGRLELYRADAELATARAAVGNARLRLATAIAQLRGAIGTPISGELRVAGQMPPQPELPPLEQLRKELLERHPDLQRARLEVQRSQSRLDYETALKRPQPSVVATYDRPPDVPIYRMGVTIPLPIWNKRAGQIAEAVAASRVASAEALSRQSELLAALEGAYTRYQLATQQLATYETGVLRAVEEGLRAAEAAYRLGERGILEVLDAQRVLRTVRLEQHHALYDLQAARIDLDEARARDLRESR